MLLIIVILAMLSGACCPCRHAVGEDTRIERDSVYITRYDSLIVARRDTMWLGRLEQSNESVETYAQHSQLSNAYCISTADVGDDGRLSHRLYTRDSAMLPARVAEVEHIVRDTVFRDRETCSERVVVKQVPRPKTWWSTTKDILLVGLAVLSLWQNRKIILAIIRLWRI